MAITLESLSEKVLTLEASMDRRFAALDEHLVDQRQYTEFAFERLEAAMNQRFDAVDRRLDALESRSYAMESRFNALEGRFDALEGRFGRLETKLDQFIDVQMATNRLVERRLAALERRRTRRRR